MTSLKKDIFANYIGKAWTAVLGFSLIPLYIKFLGVESYGLIGFFASLTAVIGILDLGISTTMTRELAKRSSNSDSNDTQRDLVRTLELIYWGISVFSGIIIFVGAPFIANYWIKTEIDVNTLMNAVRFMALSIAFRFPMSLYQGGLMGLQKQVLVNKIIVSIGTLRGFGAVLILWLFSPTIEAFFIWQAFISLAESFVFFTSIWKVLPKSLKKPSFKLNIIKEIWRYAAAISANAIISILLTQLDKIILSNMLTLKMFAYYTIAATAASSIWLIIVPFSKAVFPRLVSFYETKQKEKLISLFHNTSKLLSLLLFPFCAVLIVFSKQILSIWMQDPIIVDNAYIIMSLLVFGTMLNGMASLPSMCAPAFGWPLLLTYTNIIQSIFIIPLIIILVNWLEGIGAAIAWIILNCTYIFVLPPLFFRHYLAEEKKKWYLFDLFIPLTVAFSVTIISSLVAPKMSMQLFNIVWILGTVLIGFFATAVSIPSMRNTIYEKVIFKFKKK